MSRPVHFNYDGTFAGLLTAAAQCVRERLEPLSVGRAGATPADMFAEMRSVATDEQWNERAWKAVLERIGKKAALALAECQLAELPEVDLLLVKQIGRVLRNDPNAFDLRDPVVVALRQWGKRIAHEVHHMHAFVRFQENSDGIWTSVIAPAYDVLPLTVPHFVARYADMCWMIFDETRGYAAHYDGVKLHWVEPFVGDENTGLPADVVAEPAASEDAYCSLWRTYFHHVNIPERRNLKLQMRHMAKRHWRHMVEMGGR